MPERTEEPAAVDPNADAADVSPNGPPCGLRSTAANPDPCGRLGPKLPQKSAPPNK